MKVSRKQQKIDNKNIPVSGDVIERVTKYTYLDILVTTTNGYTKK